MKSLGPEQILNSFWTNNFDTLYELCSSGQSGALFYFTKDKNYMMKTIPKREFESLKNVLEAYLDHMLKYNDSMITTFFGMHEITWGSYRNCMASQTSYIVVMNNIFKDFTVGNRWDLKGSSQGRTYLKNGKTMDESTRNIQTAMKDNDFRNCIGQIRFNERLDPCQTRSLIDILETDTQFLASCEIIDYSLILGEVKFNQSIEELRELIEEEPGLSQNLYLASNGMIYQIGIIDPLTNFNAKKNIEYTLKRCRFGHRMSCVPP